ETLSGETQILAKEIDASGTGNDDSYAFFLNNGIPTVRIRHISGSESQRAGSVSLSTGIWQHVTFVYDGTDRVEFYVNGTFDRNVTTGSTGIKITATPVCIGCTYNPNVNTEVNFFDGYMDELTVYNRNLSASEVAELYWGSDLIVSDETSIGDIWQACVTPNDGIEDGETNCSDNLTVLSSEVTVSGVVLNSSSGNNVSTDNLTLHYSSSNADSFLIEWYADDVLFANYSDDVQSPEDHANVYLNFNTSSVVDHMGKLSSPTAMNGASWNSTYSFVGDGSYYFDGDNDYIDLNNVNSPDDVFGDGKNWTVFGRFSSGSYPADYYGGIFSNAYADTEILRVVQLPTPYINFGTRDDVDSVFVTRSLLSSGLAKWQAFGLSREYQGNITHYLNDKSSSSEDNRAGDFHSESSSGDYFLGRTVRHNNFGIWQYFHGYVDELIVYDYPFERENMIALINYNPFNLSSDFVSVGTWRACITPVKDGTPGETVCSNNLTIPPPQAPPYVENVTLNSSSGTNLTSENLTLYWDASDINGDSIYNITDWRLDGNSIAVLNMPFENHSDASTTAIDYSSHGNNGTLTGHAPTFTSDGYIGGAYMFDGINDYVLTANNIYSTADFSNGITLAAWTNMTSASGQIISIEGAYWIGPYFAGGSKFAFEIDGEGVPGAVASTTAADGDWHFVVGVADGSGNTEIFVDGVSEGTGSESYYDIDSLSRGTSVGAHPSLGVAFVKGSIDEVKIFDYPLSAEQILALYNNRTDLIVSNETSVGDNWSACVTPNDGIEDGVENCSDNLTILSGAPAQAPPYVENVTLNSTLGTNLTTENLTVYWDSADINVGDSIINITDWRLNGDSIAVLNMPFEADGDQNATDYSTFGNDGTNYGATWTSDGYIGGAYEFDGVDDYINISDDSNLNIIDNLTISAWIKPAINYDSSLPDYIDIIYRQSDATDSYSLFINPDGKLHMGSYGGNIQSTQVSWNADQWYHIVGTYRDMGGSYEGDLYIDGQSETLSVDSYDNMAGGSIYLTIGGGTHDYFNGTIDGVRIYNRSLSSEQILALYNNRSDLIVSDETSVSDVWQACVTPNDGIEDGVENCSDNLTILSGAPAQAPPYVENVTLNSTLGTNLTTENLTVYWDSADINVGDSIINITDWRLDGTSIAVLNMPFEADGDQNATDYSIFGNDGTNNGATWTSDGYIGGAYEFDGGNYINISDDDSLSFGDAASDSPFSIFAWVNVDDVTSSGIVAKQDISGDNREYVFMFRDDDALSFLLFDEVGANQIERISDNTFTSDEGSWINIVSTYDGSGSHTGIKLYRNGVELSTSDDSSGSYTAMHNLNENVVIGTNANVGANAFFNGSIDQVMIFNRSLSQEQILALYNNRTDLIVSNETSIGDNWSACVTPNDGIEDGVENCSDNLTILSGAPAQAPPYVENVTLNSTSGNNLSSDNLTVYWDAADINAGDSIINITDWRLEGTSIAVLNMPFENHSLSNETAVDYSTYGNNGTNNGATWNATGGYDGFGAYEFDGVNDYIELGPVNQLTGDISYGAWVNIASVVEDADIISSGSKGESLETNVLYALRMKPTGDIFYIHEYGEGANPTETYTFDVNLSTGIWHHLIITRDVSTNRITLYVNGTDSGSFTYVTDPEGGTSNNLSLGIANALVDQRFHGTIDNVMIFNRTLSAEQITALYNNRSDLIVSDETSVGDNWSACVTPNDGTEDGIEVCSNNLTILSGAPAQAPPYVENVTLNSSSGTNLTSENLTVYWDSADINGDSIYNITDWRLNGDSITVLNMPFEADGDQNATDYSIFGNNGTNNGATWTSAGYIGGAYEFDGDDHVNISDADSLDATDELTIMGWIKPASLDASPGANYLLMKCDDTNDEMSYGVYFRSDGRLHFPLSTDGTSVQTIFAPSTGNYGVGEWAHVAVTYEAGVGTKFYVNGTYVGLNATQTGSLYAGTGRLTMGARYDKGDGIHKYHFNGTMDDVRIYNRTLSLEQIQVLYNNRSDLIVSNETSIGDIWQACVTPNDGIEDGTTNCSDNLTILSGAPAQAPPYVENVTLNSTLGTNLTSENLTVYYDTYDINDDEVNVSINWFRNQRSYPATPENISYTDVVLNMPFENYTTGSEDEDLSIYGNDGVVTGAAWQPTGGHDGYGAYEFSSDVITISDATSIKPSHLTVEAWVKPTSLPDWATVVMKASTSSWEDGYGLGHYTGSNDINFFINEWDAANNNVGGTLSTGQWSHVVGTYNTTHLKLYINGALVDTSTNPSSSITHSSSPLEIGSGSGGTYYWAGSIDNVRIYDVALTADQALASYNNRTDLIVSNETTLGDIWQACVTPNDGVEDGVTNCSNNLTILAVPNDTPYVENVTLNSTLGTNLTSENLTVYYDAYDVNGDPVISQVAWYNNSVLLYNYSKEVLRPDLYSKLYLTFAADGDQNATDYSPNTNDGTVIGNPVWSSTAGHDGSAAYYFDGDGDWINISDSPSLQLNEAITIEAWVMFNDSYRSTIVGKGPSFNNNSYFLLTGSGSTLLCGVGTGAGYNLTSAPFVEPTGTWRHVVCVINTSGSATSVEIYVNGTLMRNKNWAGVVPATNDAPLSIGRWHTTDTTYNFNGTIDTVKIYNRSLSAEEIKASYNNRTDLIVSNETSVGDIWSACVTPNDGIEDGVTNCSNNITILSGAPAQAPPYVENVTLNATSSSNLTTDNLTVYYDTGDINGDDVNASINWFRNQRSYPSTANVSYSDVILNMPFENYTVGAEDEDISIYGNDGAVSGATWNSTGGHDSYGAYEFDGVDNFVNISQLTGIDRENFTVSVWVKPTVADQPNQWAGIVSAETSAGEYAWTMRVNDFSEEWQFSIWTTDAGWQAATDSGAYTVDRWYHLVGVWDYSNRDAYLYVDGELVDSTSVTGTDIKVHDGETRLASSRGARYFQGVIDDVQVYDTYLSVDDVLALYNNRSDLIVAEETRGGDVWQACVTPNDGTEAGSTNCSDNLTVQLSEVENVVLNSTDGTNYTSENLTVHYDLLKGADRAIINWYKNDESVMLLNMPFEADGEGISTAKDYTPFSNDGTIYNNTVWNTTGGYDGNGAYEFDGSSDTYINVPSLNGLHDHGVTVSARIKPTAADQVAWAGIVSAETSDVEYSWVMRVNSTQEKWQFSVMNTSGTYYMATASSAYTTDQWYHLVGVWDYDNNKVLLYVDGELVDSEDFVGTIRTHNAGVRIASSKDARYFNGTIDQVQIYNMTLTPEQVRLLYQNRTDMISFNETSVGDIWQACVTPNDGIEDGVTNCSNNLTILPPWSNTAPDISSVTLTTTNTSTNDTNQNLTSTVSASDIDGHNITYAYNWYKDNTLNATTLITDGLVSYYPLNNDTLDYYGSNDGTANGASRTSGQVGGGYSFDGVDDYIDISQDSSLDIYGKTSFAAGAWIYPASDGELDTGMILNKYSETLGTERVTDGNMEAGGTSSWLPSTSTVAKVADERTGGSGSQSLEIVATGLGTGYGVQTISLTQGKIYKFSGWLKNYNCSGGAISVYNAAYTSYSNSVPPDGEWTYVEGYFNNTEGTSPELYIHCTGGTGETGRVLRADEISIREVTASEGYYFNVQAENDNSVRLKAIVGHGTSPAFFRANVYADTDEFHHVAFTYNEDDDKRLKIYLDGNLTSPSNWHGIAGVGALSDDSSLDLRIGNIRDGTTRTFNGSIDEVMIFNRSLSSSEIHILYQGSTYGGHTMDSSQTSVGDEWTLGVEAADYMDWSGETNSSDLTILAPVLPDLNISLDLDPNPVNVSQNVTVSGRVNLSDGTPVADAEVHVYLNGTTMCGTIPTGGTITTEGDYTIHAFTSDGMFNVTSSFDVEVLVVAGGGGGGARHGGGGGAGGLIYNDSFIVSAENYSITIGAGGAGTPVGGTTRGSPGQNSNFSTLEAIGGGGGGGRTAGPGGAGGSGGGGNTGAVQDDVIDCWWLVDDC
ncbi:LamG-like jellyroll fold domain-containing protein, partial [Thermoproteota archaeon]